VVVVRSLSARLRVGTVRATAVLAGGALVASVLIPAAPALADTADLPTASSVTVDGQFCGAAPVEVTLDRQGSTSLDFGAVFDDAGITGAEVVTTDAAGVERGYRTYELIAGVLDGSISASELTDDGVNTLTVRARTEDGTTGPAVECSFLLHRGPSAVLSVFPVLGAETVYVRDRRRGGVGVPGAFAVASPQTPDAVSFAYGYSENLRFEPEWRTVPATENAVIPFVPTSAGEQYLQVAEVDSTGLIGQATSVQVRVAAEGTAETVPPAVTVIRLGDSLPDDGLAPFRFTLTEDLLPWGSATGAGQAALYDGTTELARVAFDDWTEDVLVRRSLAGGGYRDLRVEFVQFPGAVTLTDTARFCLSACPFTGGSATVKSLWSSGQADPSYNSAYWAVPEGFSPTPASYTYQWLRDGAAIANATGEKYLSSPADVGHRVSVRITAHGPSMSPRSVTSTPFTVRARDTMHVEYGLSWIGSPWESNYCYCLASDGQSAGLPGNGRTAQALIAYPTSGSYTAGTSPSSENDEMPSAFWFETEGYVEGRGWVGQKYKNYTPYVGTIGESRRLEAFRIKPGGPHASFYDVWYRAYVPKYGWLGWAKNGESAGTTGFGYRIESVQVRVLPRGTRVSASSTGNAPSYDRRTQNQVTVRPYLRPTGWLTAVSGGSTAGATSTTQRLNAVRVRLDGGYSGGVQVSAKVQGSWRPYVGNDQVAGTYHRTRSTSAYRMRLTGEMAERYDIYYRVHVAGTGWLGWARNGAAAGTASYGPRGTAVQVVLVKKGERPLMSASGRAAYAY
jgi:hypothetical protein